MIFVLIFVGVPRGPDSVSFSPVGPLFVKNKDDQFTIRCVSNCTPSCSYTWTRQVQNIHITLSNTNTLSFNRILPSDAGQYKCTVRNAHGEITVTKYGKMVLIVKGKDYMIVTSARNSVKSVARCSSLVVDIVGLRVLGWES